ncbi:MAG: ATP synthase F1 subunit delta [Aureispira sp.]|nr:ATP synthase F1 subunit delta [Aureispira sp.]
MSVLRIASRYASSLFSLAEEEGNLDKVHDNIMYIWEVAKTDDFAAFLKNPIISAHKKEKVFEAVFTDKVESVVLKTLRVIAEHRREPYLGDICRVFHTMYNSSRKISSARLITAAAVSESVVDGILETFKTKGLLEAQVELDTAIDPSIIGGFVLEFNNQVYDASIAYKLDQMETQFSENLYIKNF